MARTIRYFCDLCKEEIPVNSHNYGHDMPVKMALIITHHGGREAVEGESEVCHYCVQKMKDCYLSLKKKE